MIINSSLEETPSVVLGQAAPVVDISTHGPKSGATRRIEIRLLHADGRIFLSGRPGGRSWYANLRANPQLPRT